MFKRGDQVAPSGCYLAQFPKSRVRHGVILRKCRVSWPAYAVKWDERRGEEILHEKFLRKLQ